MNEVFGIPKALGSNPLGYGSNYDEDNMSAHAKEELFNRAKDSYYQRNDKYFPTDGPLRSDEFIEDELQQYNKTDQPFYASNIYQGYFHILGGTISSSGQRKEDLLINSLVERVKKDKIEEVILATSATVEGQTTAYYIQDSLKGIDVIVSKLAQGLPVGGEIESLDDGTLFSAFKNRNGISNNSD